MTSRGEQVTSDTRPTHGWTRHGHLAVHGRTVDHLPTETRYQRVNKAVAVWLTTHIGTMTCFWLFCVLAALSLPATLALMGVIHTPWVIPTFFLSIGFIYFITWISQSFIQLVLLPGLMVGQSLQNAASDARAAKQFEDIEIVKADIEAIKDLLNPDSDGGLATVMTAIESVKIRLDLLSSKIPPATPPRRPPAGPSTPRKKS